MVEERRVNVNQITKSNQTQFPLKKQKPNTNFECNHNFCKGTKLKEEEAKWKKEKMPLVGKSISGFFEPLFHSLPVIDRSVTKCHLGAINKYGKRYRNQKRPHNKHLN